MKRALIAALALALLLGLQPRAARAQDSNVCNNSIINWLNAGQDCRLFWASVGIGIGTGVASYYLTKKHGFPGHRPMSYGMAYGVTTYGCAVVYPFVGTWFLNRPLTPREMYDGVAGCIVPIIGGPVVDAWLPHTAWIDGTPAHR
jgi:hypothetical protein